MALASGCAPLPRLAPAFLLGASDPAGWAEPALSRRLVLAPLLEAVTDIHGPARATATVTLISGTVPLIALTLMPTSPRAVIDGPLIVGALTVEAGTVLHLTPPGMDQPGMVLLDITFRTDQVPATRFRAAIALWPPSDSPPAGGLIDEPSNR